MRSVVWDNNASDYAGKYSCTTQLVAVRYASRLQSHFQYTVPVILFFFFFFDYPNRKISNDISKLIVGAVCWNSNIWSRNGIGDWFV